MVPSLQGHGGRGEQEQPTGKIEMAAPRTGFILITRLPLRCLLLLGRRSLLASHLPRQFTILDLLLGLLLDENGLVRPRPNRGEKRLLLALLCLQAVLAR